MAACALLITPESNKRVRLVETPPKGLPLWMSPGEMVDCALGQAMAATQNAFVQARNARDALRLSKMPLLSPGLSVSDGCGLSRGLFEQQGAGAYQQSVLQQKDQQGVQQQETMQQKDQEATRQQTTMQQQEQEAMQQQKDIGELTWPGYRWKLGSVRDRSGMSTINKPEEDFWSQYFQLPNARNPLLKPLVTKPVQV